ncbi:MAG: MMPL family transporter [Trueperaceae bacterium]|nr:MMPL family transporter [Trueperaceae bacterium]
MDRIARFLVRRSRGVLAATALLTLAAIAMLPRLAFDADVASFLTRSNDEGRALAALQERYGAGDPIMVLLTRTDGGAMDAREGMALLAEARDALGALSAVASVGSFVPSELPIGNVALTPQAIRSLPAPLLAALRDGPGTELLLSEDGDATLLVVQVDGDAVAAARAVRDAPLPAGLEATYAGNPMVFAEVLDLLGWFLAAIPPTVIVLLLAVFTAALGGPRLAALAMLPAVLGSVWTFGLLFALGIRVDLITVIVPVFVIVMGSADGLHFVSHLRGAAARGLARDAQVASALREVGVPMILTTVSTAAGFLSLLATGVPPIRQLGGFVAIGIALAGAISFFALPALMSRLDLGPPRRTVGARIDRLATWTAARRWTAWALTIPLAAFALAFAPRLEVDADPLFFFAEGHPVRQGFEQVANVFGAATPLFGEFVVDPDVPLDPQLEALRQRSRELEALPGIESVVSLADLLPRIPAGQRQAVLSGQRPLPFGSMAREDGLRFVVLPGSYDSADVAAWRVAAAAMPEVRVLSGTPMLFEALSGQIAGAQAGSLGLAFALVALLLWITYRRLGRALLALAPITLTVSVVLGFLAASGIHLNLITVVASSIVLGVGIDYAIHLIAAIEHARRADPERAGWVLRGLRTATRPIVANALGVAIGLTALQASPLRPHHQISALMWVAMLVAATATLVLIPAASPRNGTVER